MPAGVNLLIAIPTMGAIHPLLVNDLLIWSRAFPPGQVHFYFTFKVSPVDRARNQIVEFFLKTKSPDGKPFTHLLMIDSDTVPPADAVQRLLSHDKSIVSGLTPIISYGKDGPGTVETYDNCFLEVERDAEGKALKTNIAQRGTGLQEIYRCGAACILIARGVFEMLDMPFYKFVMNRENTAVVRSEDIDFCDRVRDLGFTIYADTDVACQHAKDIMI